MSCAISIADVRKYAKRVICLFLTHCRADIELVDDFGLKMISPKESSKSYQQKQRFRTIKTGHKRLCTHMGVDQSHQGPLTFLLVGCHEYQVEYNSTINGATVCRASTDNAACCGMPGIQERYVRSADTTSIGRFHSSNNPSRDQSCMELISLMI